MRRRVCVVITARPSYSRIKAALDAIKATAALELQIVLSASALLDRYGNLQTVLHEDGFTPSGRVFTVVEGDHPSTMAKTTGLSMIELASVFDQLKPDVIVTIADRYETLATAATAAFMNIPVTHIQGGEVTGSIDEKVRHAVTKLSNLHFVSTEAAADRVRRMGEHPESVFVTGCPSIDLAAEAARRPPITSADLFSRYGGVGPSLDLNDRFLVVLQHPVTTEYELARPSITETIHAIHDLKVPTLWFWPNVDAGSDATSKGLRVFRERYQPPHIHFFRNLLPIDFLRLINQSAGIVGNSSAAIREGSFLGIPAVNIGTRQQGRERGRNVVDVGNDRRTITTAIEQALGQSRLPPDTLYGDGQAGRRIAALLSEVSLDVEKRLVY
jgi:UDP-hydrolysing UDP-N-acetyl-D-glucosamine 2-epimerase